MNKKFIESFHITSIIHGSKKVVEILLSFSIGLYYTKISTIKVNDIVIQKFTQNITV